MKHWEEALRASMDERHEHVVLRRPLNHEGAPRWRPEADLSPLPAVDLPEANEAAMQRSRRRLLLGLFGGGLLALVPAQLAELGYLARPVGDGFLWLGAVLLGTWALALWLGSEQ